MGKSSHITEQHLNARNGEGENYPYSLVNTMVGDGKKLCILLGARQRRLGLEYSSVVECLPSYHVLVLSTDKKKEKKTKYQVKGKEGTYIHF